MQWLHTFAGGIHDDQNAIKCKKCGEVIESVFLRDFKICSCGACAVDGGHEYLRRFAPSLNVFIDLSVVKLDESDDKLFFHNGTAGRGVAAACCFIQFTATHLFSSGLFAFRPFKILSGVMATLICSAGHDRPSRACSAPSSMPNDLKYKAIVAERYRGVQVESTSSP